MSDAFDVHKDPILGEEVWLARTSAGMPLRVFPTDRFQETAAMVTFRYGATDLGFSIGGDRHESPLGTAHYLEHKLFEDEAIAVFDRFARRGAQVNAMTGFTQTSYYFTATDQVHENMQDLLHLVANAHITEENVEKERGIIDQEIRMYEDSPDYRLFFDFVGNLYEEHPVRHPVGGTTDSIQEVTAEHLLDCHRAFYTAGNAALGVAGPVDPHAILELAEASHLLAGEPPTSIWPKDSGPAFRSRSETRMEVGRDRVMVGFKDRKLEADAEARWRRELVTRVLLDRWFSASSELREELRRRGLVDDSLSAGYVADFSFGFVVVSCETDDPDGVAEVLRDLMLGDVEIDEDHLERVRRKLLGRYVRDFEAVSNCAFGQAREALEGIDPFCAVERMTALSAADVEQRRQELFREDSFATAVMHKKS